MRRPVEAFELPDTPAGESANALSSDEISYIAQLLVRRRGRPKKVTLARLLADALRRPGAHGPRREIDDETGRRWIETIDRVKKRFDYRTDKQAVEHIEEDLRRQARALTHYKQARVKRILPTLARTRTRLGLNLRRRSKSKAL